MNTDLNFKQLIDLAIGSPEPGHVNFYALHFLLCSFAEKLNLLNEPVDRNKCEQASLALSSRSGYRLLAGGEPDDEKPAEEGEAATDVTQEPEPAAEAPAEPQQAAEPPPEAAEVPQQADQAQEEPADGGGADGTSEIPAPPDLSIADTEGEGEDQGEEEYSGKMDKHCSGTDMKTEESEEKDVILQTEVYHGISIMKDQIELAMESIRMLTDIVINKKTNPKVMDRVRSLVKKIMAIQRENIYIQNAFGFRIGDPYDLDALDEAVEEECEEESEPTNPSYQQELAPMSVEKLETKQYDIDLHLLYTPEKLLEQLLDLKSEFCTLTNKVNDIALTILQQDCQRTMTLLQELQEQIKDLKMNSTSIKDIQERMETRVQRDTERIENLMRTMDELESDKMDRAEIEVLLANKVDYSQLQRKVSQEQIHEMQCRLEKQFCEVHKVINLNEKNMYQVLENMRTSLGLASVDETLRVFKEKIEGNIGALQETLRQYIEATNDECAAAGARIKVLQNLACISCDTTCVMRTREKSKVGKMPNAHATNILSPLVTYELGSIRKSGIMGYYRKDEFPHTPAAWLNRQEAAMKMCVPRHAGGQHTTHTPKEHVEKVLMAKK